MNYRVKQRNLLPRNGIRNAPLGKRQIEQKGKIGSSSNAVVPVIITDMAYFCGEMERVPPMTRSEVRVFLSSTFSDYQVERNQLAKLAYPRLKAYAASLGLDFQVVDMRWGVTDDAASQHAVVDLCLREIADCQRLSYGPNFVCLLGDRYGYLPFPNSIESAEFDRLFEVADDQRIEDCSLMEEWYKKDNNAVPPAYILQPVVTKFPYFADYTPGEEARRAEDRKRWYSEEARLQKVIVSAARLAHDRGLLTAERLYHYTRSVTEAEVYSGVLAALFPRNSSVCYTRSFSNIRSADLSRGAVSRYIDVRYEEEIVRIDDDSQEKLDTLKKQKLPQKLPDANITEYSLTWRPGGIDLSDAEHGAYVKSFCDKFVSDLKHLINAHRALQLEAQRKDGKSLTNLREEVFHHLRFCNSKCLVFCGRETEIESVKSYLQKSPCRQPLVIHAPSGCGKTALTAVLARMCKTWFGKNSVIILRFLGTSAHSSNLFKLLRSLCQQICHVYKLNFQPDRCNNFSKAVKNLHHLINFVSQRFTKERPLVIILDSLDQLAIGESRSPPVSWLPKFCPPGVSVIVSTLPDDKHQWLSAMSTTLTDSRGFLDLSPIDLPTSNKIIDKYLAHKCRAVNKKQYNLILDAINNYPRPLFLKLLLDQACEWKSYQGMAEEKFPKNVREAILNLFEKLESRYGRLLVSYSLGYLTVGVNGLSEVELEDLLSSNDQVLNEVYQYHDPPSTDLVRIPPLLWSRVRHYIQDYLAERQTDGKTTLVWYHRQFIEVAHQYFVTPRAQELHADLADMYTATNGVQKTVRLEKRKLVIENCCRGVTEQPMTSSNKRLLNSLPHHLLRAGQTERLLARTYCNIEYLATYIEAFSVPDLIQALNDAYLSTNHPVLETLRDFLRFSEAMVHDQVSLAIQLLGQLGSRKEEHLKELCVQCIAVAQHATGPTLLPVGGCFPSSQSELKGYVSDVKSVICVSQDMSLVAMRTYDRRARVYVPRIISTETLSTVSICSKFDPSFGAITFGQFTMDRTWLVILAVKKIVFYSVLTGEKLFQSGLNINNAGLFNHWCATSADKRYTIVCGEERLCISEDVSKIPGQPDLNLGGHKTMKLDEQVTACIGIYFIKESHFAVSIHSGNKTTQVYVWDVDSKARKTSHCLPSSCQKSGIVVCEERVYSGCEEGQIVVIDVLNEPSLMKNMDLGQISESPVIHMTVNSDALLVAALRQNNTIVVISENRVLDCIHLQSVSKMVQLTDTGDCVVGSSGGIVEVWRVRERKMEYRRRVHQRGLEFLLTLNDEFILTHSSDEEALNLWSFKSSADEGFQNCVEIPPEEMAVEEAKPEPQLQQQNVLCICVSRDGRWLVTCSRSEPPMIWTLVTEPAEIMHVATCQTADLCDLVCLGKQDEFILARRAETGTLITFYTNPEKGSFGILNEEFESSCVCENVCASDSSVGIGACCSVAGGKLGRKSGLDGVVHVFTLKRGQILLSISLQSLDAKYIDFMNFTKCSQYVIIGYNGTNTSLLQALYLQQNDEEYELNKIINGDGRCDVSECYTALRRTAEVVDKSVKDSRCYAYTEYMGNILLGAYGVCPLWNLTTEQLSIEKMSNVRQWMKHSTAWYFQERRQEVTATNVDGAMGQMPVTALCVSSDGGLVVSGSEDGSLIVWLREVALAKEGERTKRFLKGHTNAITAILLRSTQNKVISASRDRTIRVWDFDCTTTKEGRLLTTLNVHSVPHSLSFCNARPGVRVKVNPDIEPSLNRESFIVAHSRDIVKSHVIVLRLCHLGGEASLENANKVPLLHRRTSVNASKK